MISTTAHEYLAPCCQIAAKAGEIIMGYVAQGFHTERKSDASPVTDADVAANDYVCAALQQLTPSIPIVAEESTNQPAGASELFWLVDPLDGTRSFVSGEAEYTVNIGLIRDNEPWLGIIYVPPLQTLYFGQIGVGAWRQIKGGEASAIQVRKPATDGLVVVRSKSHPSPATQSYLDLLPIKSIISGSSSIKFCQIAEGSADIYPRFGRTMEWDTAAGHAILEAAGGRVETAQGKPLVYGKAGFENPHFIAFGG
ncbi:MAG: 3'(2'),5'-bisphosphate nucleotidase CysQ [Rickettsiales bacterium]|nr:3'(2'),5'-bisphosphate nucleotidase CysQ [Rickettsiales bacterium]